MDLHTEGLPLCDGGPAADERVDRLRRALRAGWDPHYFGIYNYLAPAATKMPWNGRGEPRLKAKWWLSRRSEVGRDPCPALRATTPMLLDFGAVVCPNFVYTTGGSFVDDALVDPDVQGRLDDFISSLTTLTQRVRAGDHHA